MSKFLNVCLIVVVQGLFSQVTYAQQCFSDAQTAYEYMMAKDTSEGDYTGRNSKGFSVDINTASESQLTSLKGIGSRKAQDIILYREGMGHFKNVDDLTKVKGIGDKTVQNNRSRLTVK